MFCWRPPQSFMRESSLGVKMIAIAIELLAICSYRLPVRTLAFQVRKEGFDSP